MRYIALLRGINVGGNNIVAMPQLKACFESLGFSDVSTYINSGNVLFSTSKTHEVKLVEQCERAIKKEFGFRVVCMVISAYDLKNALAHAPKWWAQNPADKHNAIFVIPPMDVDDVTRAVGEAKPEYEQVAAHGQIIFWTAPLKTFSRTRYSQIVATDVYQSVTIRNANTTKKLLSLVQSS